MKLNPTDYTIVKLQHEITEIGDSNDLLITLDIKYEQLFDHDFEYGYHLFAYDNGIIDKDQYTNIPTNENCKQIVYKPAVKNKEINQIMYTINNSITKNKSKYKPFIIPQDDPYYLLRKLLRKKKNCPEKINKRDYQAIKLRESQIELDALYQIKEGLYRMCSPIKGKNELKLNEENITNTGLKASETHKTLNNSGTYKALDNIGTGRDLTEKEDISKSKLKHGVTGTTMKNDGSNISKDHNTSNTKEDIAESSLKHTESEANLKDEGGNTLEDNNILDYKEDIAESSLLHLNSIKNSVKKIDEEEPNDILNQSNEGIDDYISTISQGNSSNCNENNKQEKGINDCSKVHNLVEENKMNEIDIDTKISEENLYDSDNEEPNKSNLGTNSNLDISESNEIPSLEVNLIDISDISTVMKDNKNPENEVIDKDQSNDNRAEIKANELNERLSKCNTVESITARSDMTILNKRNIDQQIYNENDMKIKANIHAEQGNYSARNIDNSLINQNLHETNCQVNTQKEDLLCFDMEKDNECGENSSIFKANTPNTPQNTAKINQLIKNDTPSINMLEISTNETKNSKNPENCIERIDSKDELNSSMASNLSGIRKIFSRPRIRRLKAGCSPENPDHKHGSDSSDFFNLDKSTASSVNDNTTSFYMSRVQLDKLNASRSAISRRKVQPVICLIPILKKNLEFDSISTKHLNSAISNDSTTQCSKGDSPEFTHTKRSNNTSFTIARKPINGNGDSNVTGNGENILDESYLSNVSNYQDYVKFGAPSIKPKLDNSVNSKDTRSTRTLSLHNAKKSIRIDANQFKNSKPSLNHKNSKLLDGFSTLDLDPRCHSTITGTLIHNNTKAYVNMSFDQFLKEYPNKDHNNNKSFAIFADSTRSNKPSNLPIRGEIAEKDCSSPIKTDPKYDTLTINNNYNLELQNMSTISHSENKAPISVRNLIRSLRIAKETKSIYYSSKIPQIVSREKKPIHTIPTLRTKTIDHNLIKAYQTPKISL